MAKVKLQLDNRRLRFEGPEALKDALDASTSYRVDGYFFAPSFQSGRWDGRIHMLKKVRNKQEWTAPIGLLPDLLEHAEELGYEWDEIDDGRRVPKLGQLKLGWNAPELRPYQNDIVAAALADRGLATGKCIISLAPRGGKTLCAAKVIHDLGVPTLFLVQSERVLGQTIKMFSRVFETEIGVVGGGAWSPKPVTVATCQSLLDGGNEFSNFDCVFFDECFPAGTLVDGRKIETLQVGDFVNAVDPTALSVHSRRVTAIFKNSPTTMVNVKLSNGSSISCTSGHPFLTQNGFKSAVSLTKTDMVYVEKSSRFEQIGVDSVEILQPGGDGTFGGCCPDGFVYNLEVEEFHTYLADGVVVHNCHHVGGDEFRAVLENIDAFYKIGISATVRLDIDAENEPSNIWIRGALGPKVYERSISDLIDDGYLVRPTIELSKLTDKEIYGNYASARSHGIVNNEKRNAILTSAAVEYAEKHLPTLGLVKEKAHAKILKDLWTDAGLKVDVCTGDTKTSQRDNIIGKLVDGRLHAVIGTIFNEGIDIPPVAGVINAAGGESWIDSIQRLRNLTLFEGKTEARVRDVMDTHNKFLMKHSLKRLQHYKSHRAFNFEVRK